MLLIHGHDERVRCIAYAPDGRILASAGSDWTVRLWDVFSGEELRVIRAHNRNILGLAFSPGGRLLVSSANAVRLWEVESGLGLPLPLYSQYQARQRLDEMGVGRVVIEEAVIEEAVLRAFVADLGPSPDAGRIGAAEAAAWRVRMAPPRWVSSVEAAEIRAARQSLPLQGAGSPYSEGVMLDLDPGPPSQSLFVRVTQYGTRRGTFVPGLGWSVRYQGEIEACFSPDGSTIAATAGDRAQLWRVDGSGRFDLVGHSDMVRALAFAPDGETLATSGYDGTIRLWDVRDGAEKVVYHPDIGVIDSLAFAPDGATLAAGGKRGINLLDAGEGF